MPSKFRRTDTLSVVYGRGARPIPIQKNMRPTMWNKKQENAMDVLVCGMGDCGIKYATSRESDVGCV